MSEDKKFKIGSKTQEQFLSEYSDEANAEYMISNLLTNSHKEDIEEILTYLEGKA